ncbi:hypothetical protein BACCOPRO_00953 [Phocaeicola coprophilus DSM 18228 = JCM 13818]|uniref:Uncharacterized protein n=1 Tax=Phocaeicola coprophilus DSM 18228 = JCM 13818 TaxID=547042 RepID=S0F5K6_9BACT|nr:hypothetical protein BACCOPRO_00953 [Phocaeicola coprophilus DSM 18228 = JCM 13818]
MVTSFSLFPGNSCVSAPHYASDLTHLRSNISRVSSASAPA